MVRDGFAVTDRVLGLGSESLRRRNLSSILRHVHVQGPASRSELATVTGLNRSTVGALVADLAERGLVRESRPRGARAPGRPSPVVEVRCDVVGVLTAEVFADSLAVAVVGLGGHVLGRIRVDRRREATPPAEVAARLAELARAVIAAHPVRRLTAMGIAVAGLAREEDGFVAIAPNLGWREVPLAALVRDALDPDVPILVGNDADLAAVAEHIRGAGVDADDFILLWGEVGVGAGMIIGGRPLRGRSGYAGEVGHLPMDANGARCKCGSRGCWETLVAEDALLRAVGRADSPEPRKALDEVLAAATAGDPVVIAAVDRVGEWLGIGLATLVNTLNPRRIALGGLFGRLYPFVSPVIERQLDLSAMPASRAGLEVVAARLGGDAPLLGASELALRPILADPTTVPLLASPSRVPTPVGAMGGGV